MTFDIMGRSFHLLTDESQWAKVHMLLSHFWSYKSAVLGLVFAVLGLLLSIPGALTSGRKQKVIRWIRFQMYTVGLFLLFVTFHDRGGYGVKPFTIQYFLTDDGSGFHESRVLICLAYVMIFAPVGFFLAPLLEKRWYLAIPLLLLLAELIECLQYVLETGLSGQWDAISYFAGALLGLLFGKLRYRKKRSKRSKKEQD